MRPERFAAITGLTVSTAEMLRILTALGFDLREETSSKLTFVVPSWRHDVLIEEDLVEEIARHTGYDKIATGLPPASLAGEYHSTEKSKRALRQALSATGFNEAIGFSFIDANHDDQFQLIPAFETGTTQKEPFVALQNPIIEDWIRMRPTLLPGLPAAKHDMVGLELHSPNPAPQSKRYWSPAAMSAT